MQRFAHETAQKLNFALHWSDHADFTAFHRFDRSRYANPNQSDGDSADARQALGVTRAAHHDKGLSPMQAKT
jgi:hypothetical protein